MNEKWLHCKIDIFTIYILLIPFLTKKISGKILCHHIPQTSNHQAVKTPNDCSKRGQYFQSIQPAVLSDYYVKTQRANVLILRPRNARKNYCQISPATACYCNCCYVFLQTPGKSDTDKNYIKQKLSYAAF